MAVRKHWLLVVLDWLFVFVTIVCALALLFALIAPYVSPNGTTFFAFFALGAPIAFVVNLLLFAIWLARWKRFTLLPFVILVWSFFYVGRFVQTSFTKDYRAAKERTDALSVITFNVHGFGRSGAMDDKSNLADILTYLVSDNSDVICLQEYEVLDSATWHTVDTMLYGWPYRAFTHDTANHHSQYGQAVFSKFPISAPHPVIFEGTENSALFVDLYWVHDTVRLFNCHLQTTAFNSINDERGVKAMLADKDAQQMARTAMGRLNYNFKIRASQADTVAGLVTLSPYPAVVVGDLNSPPMTYTYQTVRGDLADAFCAQGSGYGYTYRPMKGLFRIDYLFFDRRTLACIYYDSPSQQWSDHNPVKVKLTTNKQ